MTEASKLKMQFETAGDAAAIASLHKMDQGLRQVQKTGQATGGVLGTAFGAMGGIIGAQAVGKLFEFGKGILFADAQAEQLRMSLETVVGDRAEGIYKNLQEFAKATPFAFPELVTATNNLESFGISSEKWIPVIGDTASAMGKSVDQVTQAVLDASSGQYERLKELGILARVEGDKLVVGYMKNGKLIEQSVDKTNRELINDTIYGIWNEKYDGAMEKQSKSFIGQWSTLKDNVSFQLQTMSGGIFGFATSAIGFMNDIFANGFYTTLDTISPSVSGMIEGIVGVITGAKDKISGAFHALFGKDTTTIPLGMGPGFEVTTFIGPIRQIAEGIIEVFGEGSTVRSVLEELPESWQAVGLGVFYVADAAGQMWTNVRQGDWGGVINDLQQAATGFLMVGGAIGQKLIPEIQKFLDTNRFSGFTAAIRIDSFQATFNELAKGDLAAAINEMSKADPINITPEIELNIAQSVRNWLTGIGPGRSGGGGGEKVDISEAFIGAFEVQGIGSRMILWFQDKVAPDIGRALRAGFDGVLLASNDWVAGFELTGGALVEGILNGAVMKWVEVDQWFNTRDDAAKAAVGDLLTTLQSNGTDLIHGMYWAGVAEWELAYTWLKGRGESAVNAVGDLSATLYSAGQMLVQGLINGIDSMLGALGNKIVELANKANIIKTLWDMKSPSRMSMQWGEFLVAGLVEGVDRSAPRFNESMAGLAGLAGFSGPSLSPSRQPAMPRYVSSGGGGGNVYIFEGSIVGADIERYIQDKIDSGQVKRVNRSMRGARLAESY